MSTNTGNGEVIDLLKKALAKLDEIDARVKRLEGQLQHVVASQSRKSSFNP